MKAVEPTLQAGTRLVAYAEDQSEYETLPALVDENGVVMTEWVLTEDEVQRMVCGGRLRLWIHTFKSPLQPIRLEVVEPEMAAKES